MDLTSPKAIREIRNKFGFTFKKGLGQNFLTSREILEKIVESAEIDGGVMEIGPGFGVLTRDLSAAAKKVAAIEIDERLIEVLRFTLADCENVKIIHGDALKLDLGALIAEEFEGMSVSVAANLPYYITTPIITRLLEERLPVKNIVVMVQKEVADRLAAKPGTKDYGAVSVLCQYFTEPETVAVVPAELFVPQPKVDSAVLKMRVLDEPKTKPNDEKLFFKTVKAAFSQRRKTLLNCLSGAFPIPKERLVSIMTSAGIAAQRRGETLTIEEFTALADELKKEKL